MPNVNPEILSWARETAGLTTADAAKKLVLGGKKRSGVARLEELETGQSSPSPVLLQKMSKVYRRPLLTFYLSSPPIKANRGHDFRMLPKQHTTDEPLVDVLVRDVRARQSMVRSILEDEEVPEELAFVGSVPVSAPVEDVRDALRDIFGIDIPTYRKKPSVEEAFNYLREKAENAGVFVLLIGNLGSHHTDLDVSAFRGFALADRLAPFVVINDRDAKTAWSFSLLHELAHILLGETGISGAIGDSKIEVLCNDAASLLLVPAAELRVLDEVTGQDMATDAAAITRFARPRHVSRSMVAYRLFKAGQIKQAMWEELTLLFRREWLALKEKQKEKAKASEKDSGPNYYVVRRHRIGAALLRFVERSMDNGMLTPSKAGKVLGVKARSVAPLLTPTQRAA
jgi:Zn-dependent peptidase ImmA (M78 family)/transcriptional regulator with XRE-family HTH domain